MPRSDRVEETIQVYSIGCNSLCVFQKIVSAQLLFRLRWMQKVQAFEGSLKMVRIFARAFLCSQSALHWYINRIAIYLPCSRSVQRELSAEGGQIRLPHHVLGVRQESGQVPQVPAQQRNRRSVRHCIDIT